MKVLLIDDDLELARAMQPVLKTYSIDLDAAQRPEDGLQKLKKNSYDLLLLDIMLPKLNGFDVCRHVRASAGVYKHIPIIMLTARTDLTDLVVGLETGADDYVTKPFEPRELVARIHAVRRRFGVPENEPGGEHEGREASFCFQIDGTHLVVDRVNARVYVGRANVPLTSMEFDLLVLLCKEAGRILNRDDLIFALQGVNRIYSRSIDAMIYRLRHKLRSVNSDVDFIRTVRGRGYSLIGQRVVNDMAGA